MKKRFLAILLAMCLVMGTCPVWAEAASSTAYLYTGRLNGTVTDAATGQPLSGVNVYVYYDYGGGNAGFFGPYATTDAQGKYYLEVDLGSEHGGVSKMFRLKFERERYHNLELDNVLIGMIDTSKNVQMYPDSSNPGGGDENYGEIIESGKCGENVYWTYYADGTLSISGTGKMNDYDTFRGVLSPWYKKFAGKIVNVHISDGVTNIAAYAFDDCSSLTHVTIPNGVTTIGTYAFDDCGSLTHVTIPNGVSTIGAYAFNRCNNLTSVTIPNSVTTIENGVFAHCSSLVNVTLPNSVTSLGQSAFDYCSSLVSVTLPSSVISIQRYTFNHCSNLTHVTIPNSVTTIGEGAFYNCSSLVSITLPNSVTTIVLAAFTDCSSLADVYFSGTEEQWRQMYIGWNRDYLSPLIYDATIHYNSTGPDNTSGTTPTPIPFPTPTSKPTSAPTTLPSYDPDLTQLASQWTRAYDQYTDSIKTVLEKSAGSAVHGDNLDNLARKLESKYGTMVVGYGLTAEQKVVVYKALLKMLAQETSYQLDLSGVKMSKLDKVPSAICKAVANGIGSSTYTYTEDGGKKVDISLSFNYGTNFGLATYWEKGRLINSVVISSTKKDVEKVVSDYMKDLVDLEEDALQQAAKEAYKDLSKSFFGSTPDSFSKSLVKSGITKISNKLKLGNVEKVVANCYNYYGFIKGIESGASTEKLLEMLAGTKDITFSDSTAKEIATTKALKLMEKARKEIEKVLKKEPTGVGSFIAKGIDWVTSIFNCPINISVYDESHRQIGYIGDDDEWFDEDVIYIERDGDTKKIYSYSHVFFEVTGTDYGTLNFTAEEYQNGSPIGRINLFDIDLYEGCSIEVDVPQKPVEKNMLVLTADGVTQINVEDYPASKYDSLKVQVNAIADSALGGTITGGGEYVIGDSVKLLAQAKEGYVFLGWKDTNGTLIGISPTLELIAKENHSYTAQFEKPTNPDNLGDEPTATPKPTNTPTPPLTPNPTPIPTTSPIPEPTATPNPAETTFPDVPQSAYYYEAVKWAVKNHIVLGYPDGEFKPDRVCNRAEAMTVFYRVAGSPDIKLDSVKFNDVGTNHWANKVICWAVEHGFALGTSSDTFSPNNQITRAQAMTFLYRMAGSPKIDGVNPFKDVKSSDYYYYPVMWAVDVGITTGTSRTQFSPNMNCTRAQLVTLLYRYLVKSTENPNRELTEAECWKIATEHWSSQIVPGKATVFHASKKETFDGKTYYHYSLNHFVDSYWSAIDYLFVDISNGDCYFGVQRPEYKV